MLASTFTVDPLAEALSFLMREVGLDLPAVGAPYGQLFQELLNPGGLFGRNRGGVNVLLLRFEDWWRDEGGLAPNGADRGGIERVGQIWLRRSAGSPVTSVDRHRGRLPAVTDRAGSVGGCRELRSLRALGGHLRHRESGVAEDRVSG